MQYGSADSSILDYSRIPPRLKDLLRREVCLNTSRGQLETALQEFDRQKREVEMTRPPFLFLQRKSVREQFSQKLSDTTQTVEALNNGIAKIDQLLPRLHEWIFEEIERLLTAGKSAYLQGLARNRFHDDWHRFAQRFAHHCDQFGGICDQLHAAVVALQKEQRIAGQLHIIEMVKTGRGWGALIDSDFKILALMAQLQKTGNHRNPLPEVPDLRCETNIARIAMIDDVNTRDLLGRFVARYKQTAAELIAACRIQVSMAAMNSIGDLTSYIDGVWDLLRTRATSEFNPVDLERTLIDTERMLERHDHPST